MPELHLNETVFGLITSAFFVGCILFEILSNLRLLWIGAPKRLKRIMTLWGLAIVSMAWERNEHWFYIQRFLLGAFEAGFFPGVLLHLRFWFPNHQRGRATNLFLVGIPLSGVLGGAISGGVMEIAMISCVGQFGGLSGPALVGWVFQETGSVYTGLSVAAVLLLVGVAVAVFVIPHARPRRPAEVGAD